MMLLDIALCFSIASKNGFEAIYVFLCGLVTSMLGGINLRLIITYIKPGYMICWI
jgi:hypothetical protein